MNGNVRTVEELGVLLNPVFRRNRVARAAVFGSFARGERFNDFDFLVNFEEGFSLLDLCGLFEELKESLHKDVDILTPDSIKQLDSAFQKNIHTDAVTIYEK